MAAIGMVAEEDAIGEVAAIYADIKATLGIDFVPNLYRVMAPKPGFLAATWAKTKAVMVAPGKLDRLTREIIAVAVSAVNSCVY
jgi:alkylhydroperoxidase family enzyme